MAGSLEDATPTSRDSRDGEYRTDSGPGHGTAQRASRGRSLRPLFFSLAALWGFAAGALVVTLAPEGVRALALFPGAAGAIVGGWLSSKAYTEIRRRS